MPSLIGKRRHSTVMYMEKLQYLQDPHWKAVNIFFLHLIFHIIHASLRKYPSDCAMPLTSTCSAAISAACHRPEADKEAHLLPVQWGVAGRDDQDNDVYFCSFTTSRDVAAPEMGSSYLGIASASEDERRTR